MVSITDVAKKAGCSATLVSRVINNQYGVSDKSRQIIKAAIEELGYTPNSHARSLVLKKTNTIGVVIDTLCDAYFFDLIKGIESEIDKHGYDVLFCSGGNST
ncbi:MAG: LacI family DNA-binding transcriptional regulator, partial [Mobilitalea sp.]